MRVFDFLFKIMALVWVALHLQTCSCHKMYRAERFLKDLKSLIIQKPKTKEIMHRDVFERYQCTDMGH